MICLPCFLLLCCFKCFGRNNSLMGIVVEIPTRETLILNLRAIYTDRFLGQYSARILFVGQQFIKSFPAPLGFSCGRQDALLLQPSGNLAQAVTAEVAVENLTDNGYLIRVNDQFTVWASVIAVAPTPAILEGHPGSLSANRPERICFFRCSSNFVLSIK